MYNHHWTVLGGATAVFLAAAYVFWGPAKPKKRGGFPGLLNVGNSCYLNVILQSWAACPSLLRWMGACCTSYHKASGSLTATVLKVLKVLNNVSDGEEEEEEEEALSDVYCPIDVMTALDRKGWSVSFDQQDCHELMQALSSRLQGEIGSNNKVLSLFDVKALQDTKCGQGSQAVAKTRVGNYPAVLPRRQESPLYGLLASQQQCLSCGFQSPVKYDTFDCLTLTMPHCTVMNQLEVEHLLSHYVRPEIVDQAQCANCSFKHTDDEDDDSKQPLVQRTLSIGKLPQCLSLHLQRLHYSSEGVAIKRQDHVWFSDTLCMDPFLYNQAGTHAKAAQRLRGGKQKRQPTANLHRSSAPVNLLRALNYDACISRNGLFLRPPSPLVLPPSMADVNHNGPATMPDVNHNSTTFFKSKASAQHTYYLTAVISHLGDVESGHFVTYRRGPMRAASEQEQCLGDTWWFTSDSTVRKTTLQQVLASQAYMLFYERV